MSPNNWSKCCDVRSTRRGACVTIWILFSRPKDRLRNTITGRRVHENDPLVRFFLVQQSARLALSRLFKHVFCLSCRFLSATHRSSAQRDCLACIVLRGVLRCSSHVCHGHLREPWRVVVNARTVAVQRRLPTWVGVTVVALSGLTCGS